MKITDLQKIDQNIIKFLAEHRGIDRAVKGKILAQALDIDFRTLQSRIEYLHKQLTKILLNFLLNTEELNELSKARF